MHAAAQTTASPEPFRLSLADFPGYGPPADGSQPARLSLASGRRGVMWKRHAMVGAVEFLVRLETRCVKGGRGPVEWDWLGVLRCAAQLVRDLEHGRPSRDMSDLDSTGDVRPDALGRLLGAWGMVAIPPAEAGAGDVALYRYPTRAGAICNASVITAGDGRRGTLVLAPYFGALTHAAFPSNGWGRAFKAFTWGR